MRPYRVAIVGSGPSGFFAAAAFLRSASTEVDMLEMLPTPWGLVRSGVAPDHPKIKTISGQFAATATDARFRFFGNITVGDQVRPAELAERYDAVVYAVGTQADRALGIAGEDLPGSVAAVDFVGWYNAHPHFAEMSPDLTGGRAIVVGNGNVALDVARVLVAAPDALAATDIADHALAALRGSAITEVVVVGRRGPLQATFTTLELRELGELAGMADVDVIVDPADLADITETDLADASRSVRQNIAVLRDYAARTPVLGRRRIVFRFHTSPLEIGGTDRVEWVLLGRNDLVAEPDGRIVAKDTGERERLPAQLVVRAVGYRGTPLAGLPFDERSGTIPNVDGKVAGSANEYVVGWIKRGPSGVIGSNKKCANDTVAGALADLTGREPASAQAGVVAAWLAERQPALVTGTGWRAIDAYERASGEQQGRPRVKLTDVEQLVQLGQV